MKRIVSFSILGLLLIAALIYGNLRMAHERAQEAQGEKPIAAQSRIEYPTNGPAAVILEPQAQRLIGLQTAVVSPASLPPEIRTYGRVLDAAPLVQLLSSIASARVALEGSSKEYQRVKALFEHGENASAKALEVAEAAMKRDHITLQAAEAQLISSWGESIASLPDLPGLVDSLSKLRLVIVRLDLPAGQLSPEAPTAARLLLPVPGDVVSASFLGRATVTDPQNQGQGFLFIATNSPPQFSSGLALTGFLQMPGPPLSGVIVPEPAVVRDAGKTWAYVQTDPTRFLRRLVSEEHPVPGGWFVTDGWRPQDRVVITGAQTLLSEEHKTEIKVGD